MLKIGDRVRCRRVVELNCRVVFWAGDVVWITQIVCQTFVHVTDRKGTVGLGLVGDFEEDFELAPHSYFLKENVNSCQGNHPHGEWCLKVIVALSGPNPTVSRKDRVVGLFETPFCSQDAAELGARSINRERFGKSLCPSCGAPLTFNGGCTSSACSGVHDSI